MISFIIPTFNASKRIERCLNSIKNQKQNDIEIIIVDDGSNDNTYEIAREYAFNNQELCIRVFRKTNGGAGSARNYGIEKAKGEYIFFMDADDFLVSDSLSYLINTIIIKNPDIIYFDYYHYYSDDKYKYIKNHDEKFLTINDDFIMHSSAPWLMLVKKTLIDNSLFRFPCIRAYEDYACLPFLGTTTNRIVYLDKPIYVYSQEDISIMRSANNDFDNKYVLIIDATKNLINLFGDSYKEYASLEYLVMKELIINGELRILNCKGSKTEIENSIRLINRLFFKLFPNWRNNPYYKTSSIGSKLEIYFLLNGHYLLLNILSFLFKIKYKIFFLRNEGS